MGLFIPRTLRGSAPPHYGGGGGEGLLLIRCKGRDKKKPHREKLDEVKEKVKKSMIWSKAFFGYRLEYN